MSSLLIDRLLWLKSAKRQRKNRHPSFKVTVTCLVIRQALSCRPSDIVSVEIAMPNFNFAVGER
jgi:hypothetical protein